MKGFEPWDNPVPISDPEPPVLGLSPVEKSYLRALEPFTDLQLLLELRRRKVLGRVEYSTIAPGHAVASGYPLDAQIRKAYDGLAYQLNRSHKTDYQPPGFSVEYGNFERFGYDPDHKDRKVKLVLNYVVDFKR